MKDQLYLLKANFTDQGEGPFFCPESAMIEGMLSFYPLLREKIEVHYIDFQKPRQEIVSIIGVENQGMPKLIIGDDHIISGGFKIDIANGRKFIENNVEICRYLAKKYGCGMPH